MSLLVKPAYKKKMQPQQQLYNQLLITRKIAINITNIGNTIKETLEKAIATQIEGKCIVEGYIRPRSVEVITFSSGLVMGASIIFDVVIQCEACLPVEGMQIKCIAKHINKAGIRAEVNEQPSPIVVFVARDHNYASPLFGTVKEGDDIKVRVIGQRFELNDKYISIIAEIVEDEKNARANVVGQAQAQAAAQASAAQASAAAAAEEENVIVANVVGANVVGANVVGANVVGANAPTEVAKKPTTNKKATIRIKLPKITVKN